MHINRHDQNFLKTLTVLYVEDDEETRTQYCEFLSRPVGKLLTAADGAEGLELFIKHSPDIVVTDILMPVMDGLTMSYEIKGLNPAVPIIVITAFEQSDYLLRAINTGIDKYVTKPVNSCLLFDCLLECAHLLRAEKMLLNERQQEIDRLRMRHHETLAVLAGGMAHDYNNLLQAILGYAHLVKSRLDSHGYKDDLSFDINNFYDQADNLGKTLQVLGKASLIDTKCGELISTIEYSMQNELKNSSVELTITRPDQLPAIRFQPTQMVTVFSKLAKNAIEAMPSGGKLHITVSKTILSDFDDIPLSPGSYLHIIFSDNGTGIPKHILPRIFDPYFTTKDRCSQKGMGLSLALCHTIIMNHDGFITAESTLGAGTTFYIWLPVTETGAVDAEQVP